MKFFFNISGYFLIKFNTPSTFNESLTCTNLDVYADKIIEIICERPNYIIDIQTVTRQFYVFSKTAKHLWKSRFWIFDDYQRNLKLSYDIKNNSFVVVMNLSFLSNLWNSTENIENKFKCSKTAFDIMWYIENTILFKFIKNG